MLAERLDKFFFKLKKYIVTQKNGFYILPFVANSPQVMIESLSGIPYNKPDPDNNIITTNNPFTKGTFEYQEIEEGLWLMYIDLDVKKNISHNLLYDPSLPSDYYNLAFRLDTTDAKIQIIGGHNFQNNSGIFSKPKAQSLNFFHKDSKSIHLVAYFSSQWLEKNIKENAFGFYNSIQYFIDSDRESMNIPHFFCNTNTLTEDMAAIFSHSIGNANNNKLSLKIKTLELLQYSLFKISKETQNSTISHTEVLLGYIYQPFPGIPHLSKEIGISPSKLKTDFKKEVGKSLFQFFQEKQMALAKQMLSNDSLLIKNISYTFGYENVSKFSAAFKKHHGHLPSERNY
jgi:AraC-like DNA-binding protein